MGILDKFFGEGIIKGRGGEIKGRIDHISDDYAVIYDENYDRIGEYRAYGNTVYKYDNNGNIVSYGSSYEGDDYITMNSSDGIIETVRHEGDRSYSYDSSYNYSQSYSSSFDDDEDDEDHYIWYDDDY